MFLRSFRFRVALVFGFLLMAGLRFAGQGSGAADQTDLERYQAAMAFLRALTSRPEGLFSESDQRQLQELLLQLVHATNYWSQASDSGSAVVKQARRDAADAVGRLERLLDNSSQVERVWGDNVTVRRTWPYGS